jgi:hypothetical protein
VRSLRQALYSSTELYTLRLSRQVEVENHEIGTHLLHEQENFFTIPGFADDPHIICV